MSAIRTGLVGGLAGIAFGVVAVVYGDTRERVGGALILAGGAVFFLFSVYGVFYWRRRI